MLIRCEIPHNEDQFVEYSEVWSRRDIRHFNELRGEEYMALLRTKIVNLHLRDQFGGVIERVEDLTEDFVDNLQWEVFQWFSGTAGKAVGEIVNLGEAARRSLFVTSESIPEPSPQTA